MCPVFRVARGPGDMARVLEIRDAVFCAEQGVAHEHEHDERDATAIHVLGDVGAEAVATARLRACGGYAKLERIAVTKPFRGRGIGHALTDFLVALARERGFATCRMHAQAHLQEFYARHGFRACGPVFLEAGIAHVLMVRAGGEHSI